MIVLKPSTATAITYTNCCGALIQIKMEVGSKVIVNRQIGKNGMPTKTKGVIKRFSSTIQVNGKPTAVVVFDDDKEIYWFPIDEIKVVQ